MRITVTADDISRGIPTNFFACPMALAISRVTKKSVGVAWGIRDEGASVCSGSTWYPMLFRDGKWTFINLPMEAMNWINDYDRRLPVQPIEFDLTG